MQTLNFSAKKVMKPNYEVHEHLSYLLLWTVAISRIRYALLLNMFLGAAILLGRTVELL